MNTKQANYLLTFFKTYNIFSTTDDEILLEALKQVPTNGKGLNNLLNLNGSYISHEIIRKVPEDIRNSLKRTNSSWIHNILLEYDRCPICGNIKNNLQSTTCSNSCSNKHFRSGSDNANFTGTNYRTICFEWHEKRCIICGEVNIVEVHHYDEDRNNNDPSNLVPLCPTHHQYWHSKFKYIIEDEVTKYITRFNQVS